MSETSRKGTDARLDETFASAAVFSLMAVVHDGADLEAATLQWILSCDAAILQVAARELEKEKYVVVDRSLLQNAIGDWVRSTSKGRAAFGAHLRALREIALADDE